MDWNGKVKLLVSELFRGGRDVKNATWRQNVIHLSKKKPTDFGRIISYQTLKTVRKFLKRRSRSFDAFVPIFAARCYASAAYVVMQCLYVCLSVTFVSYVKTNKHTVKNFSPSGSHAVLVFPCQTA